MSYMTLGGRVNTEEKERRRKWAQKITPRPSKAAKKSQGVSITESQEEPNDAAEFHPESIVQRNKAVGFLPKSIVEMLAAREKY